MIYVNPDDFLGNRESLRRAVIWRHGGLASISSNGITLQLLSRLWRGEPLNSLAALRFLIQCY